MISLWRRVLSFLLTTLCCRGWYSQVVFWVAFLVYIALVLGSEPEFHTSIHWSFSHP